MSWYDDIGGGINKVGTSLGFGGNPGQQPTYNQQYQVPGYNQQYNQYSAMQQQFHDRNLPWLKSYTAGNSAYERDQRALGQQLALEAQGRGVGQQVVRTQAQQTADRAAQQQLAMAAGARPGQGAQAYQNAAMNAGNLQSQVGGQAALAGGQMQLGAMNQYGGFLQGARGQDLQRQMFNASQLQQGGQFNYDARLRQMGLNDQAELEALRQRMGLSDMQQRGGLAYNQNLNSYGLGQMQQPTAAQGMWAAAGGAAGAIFGKKGTGG